MIYVANQHEAGALGVSGCAEPVPNAQVEIADFYNVTRAAASSFILMAGAASTRLSRHLVKRIISVQTDGPNLSEPPGSRLPLARLRVVEPALRTLCAAAEALARSI